MFKKYEKMVKYCNDFPSNDRILFVHVLCIGVHGNTLKIAVIDTLKIVYGEMFESV